jgi:hypothetical protein
VDGDWSFAGQHLEGDPVVQGSGFDHLTKGIGDVLSRRGVLRSATIGTLGLGLGLSSRLETNAKKKRKKSKKNGDVNKLCKTQVGQCVDLLGSTCAADEKCLQIVQTCCPSLGTCNLGGFFACLLVETSKP